MNDPCNQHIRQALQKARELMLLADEGDAARGDNGCGVLYGVIRDCAYRIRSEAEREREAHRAKGQWDG